MAKAQKVCLVIGGSSGIGLCTARRFLRDGFKVYNASREKCPDERVCSFAADVTEKGALEAVFKAISDSESRLDVLVYSAGFSMASPVQFAKEKDYRYLFDVNFFGALRASQLAVEIMSRSKTKSRIIFVSSVGGVVPIPFDAFYSASKAALNMLAKGLNLELDNRRIKVYSVMPGGTDTDFTFERKVYRDDEVGGYAKPMKNAVAALSDIEQGGMQPERVADRIYKIATEDALATVSAVGTKNAAYCVGGKLMPCRLTDAMLRSKYDLRA